MHLVATKLPLQHTGMAVVIKKWWYGFKLVKEVSVCHTAPLQALVIRSVKIDMYQNANHCFCRLSDINVARRIKTETVCRYVSVIVILSFLCKSFCVSCECTYSRPGGSICSGVGYRVRLAVPFNTCFM